jgi:hypothetical protein
MKSYTWMPSQTAFDGIHWLFDWQVNSFDEHFTIIGQSIYLINDFIGEKTLFT